MLFRAVSARTGSRNPSPCGRGGRRGHGGPARERAFQPAEPSRRRSRPDRAGGALHAASRRPGGGHGGPSRGGGPDPGTPREAGSSAGSREGTHVGPGRGAALPLRRALRQTRDLQYPSRAGVDPPGPPRRRLRSTLDGRTTQPTPAGARGTTMRRTSPTSTGAELDQAGLRARRDRCALATSSGAEREPAVSPDRPSRAGPVGQRSTWPAVGQAYDRARPGDSIAVRRSVRGRRLPPVHRSLSRADPVRAVRRGNYRAPTGVHGYRRSRATTPPCPDGPRAWVRSARPR